MGLHCQLHPSLMGSFRFVAVCHHLSYFQVAEKNAKGYFQSALAGIE